jgi:VWFA-related protein
MTGMISHAFVSMALLVGSGLAQNAQAPEVVIRSSAREVLLDVVVRDAHGKLVTNLKPDDIVVYEDGVRQDVRSFRLVAGSEVRMADQRQEAEAQAAAATAPAPAPPVRPPVNPLRIVNLVSLILNDLDTCTRALAFESARKFVDQELRPNTFIGVFTLDSTGLRPIFPFSNNRERLLKAVQLASVNQLPTMNLDSAAMLNSLTASVGAMDPGSAAMMNGLATQAGVSGLGSRGSGNDALGSQHDMTFAAVQGLREIDALKGLIGQLRPLPFQKTLLLLSNGLTRPPDQLEYWDSMVHAAIDASVTFYAVDVHGMTAPGSPCFYDPTALSTAMLGYAASLGQQQGATSRQGYTPSGNAAINPPNGPSLASRTMEQAHQDDYVRFAVSSANPQEALRELAERTGGFLIANTNNVDQLLSHVMEEVDTHYEIAYPPRSERDDGHFRKIEVKLTRAGFRVETRNGYFAVPDNGHPLAPEEMAGLRALDTQPHPHAFDFLSRAYRFCDSGGQAQYAIAFEMPISKLTATAEEGAHRHRFHVSLLAVVKNQDGVIVDRVSKDVPSIVADDQFEKVRWEYMTYQQAVNLPHARYTVETAVVDHEGNRASTGAFEIDNRRQRGIGMSDLAVVRKLENITTPADPADPFEYTGKRVLPFVNTNLFPGTKPFVFFMMYPDEAGNGAKPLLRVRLLKDGRTIATLRPEVSPPNAAGGIPVLLRLTDKPGSYELRATVSQGNSSTERTLQYAIAR